MPYYSKVFISRSSVHLVVIICTVPCSTMFTPWLFNDHPGKARQGLFANINVATNLTSENRPLFQSFAKLRHCTVNIRTLDFLSFYFFCVKFNSVSHLVTSKKDTSMVLEPPTITPTIAPTPPSPLWQTTFELPLKERLSPWSWKHSSTKLVDRSSHSTAGSQWEKGCLL